MRPASSVPSPTVRPGVCPGCSAIGTVVPILYGFHAAAEEERARKGDAVLGTFSGGPGAPRWECLTCGARMR